MKRVIIVGGGVSGITCGIRLMEHGHFEVTLLEADSRVGGRVHTAPFGDHCIEQGAQWVNGENRNEIFKLANSAKLLHESFQSIWDAEDSSGKFLSAGAVYVTNKGRIVEGKVQQKIGQALARFFSGPLKHERLGSVGEWAKTVFQREFEEAIDPEWPSLDASVLDLIHRMSQCVSGSDWFQLSLQGKHEYKDCAGNQKGAWKLPASYSSLLGLILNGNATLTPTYQPTKLPPWIELGKEVNKIDLAPECDKVHVKCADGSQYSCDIVICTVSLGVLKHTHKGLFQPALPDKKVLAIESLGIGCINKIHLYFKKQWWSDGVYGYRLIWEGDPLEEKYWRSDIDDETLKKEIDGIPIWCRSILGFIRIPSHPKNVLSGWISGPAAKLMEVLPEKEVKVGVMKVLKRFLGKLYEIPEEPVEFCRSSWGTNKLTRGSYSFRQMESEERDVWARDLAEPVMNNDKLPVICFAGEATHDCYYSTVHGAYETGIREAERLINAYAHSTVK